MPYLKEKYAYTGRRTCISNAVSNWFAGCQFAIRWR